MAGSAGDEGNAQLEHIERPVEGDGLNNGGPTDVTAEETVAEDEASGPLADRSRDVPPFRDRELLAEDAGLER